MTIWAIVTHVAFILGVLLAIVALGHMLRQRRSPAGTVAWLLAFVLIPYIGVPLYLLIGSRKVRQVADSRAIVQPREMLARVGDDVDPVERLLRGCGIPGATAGNRLELCLTGEETYARLIRLIDEATRSIWVTTFILARDEVGQDIVARLAKRAAEGIEVRLLLDGLGSIKVTQRFLDPLKQAGGRIGFFNPVIQRAFPSRTNLRNHRKIVVIDERRVMSGGTNLACEYIGPAPLPSRWRDLTFILEGPATRIFGDIFRSDWKYACGEVLTTRADEAEGRSSDGESRVQVVPSGPDVFGDPLYSAILTAAYAARRRIWIATAYFVPDEALIQSFSLAARRGVDVRLLVPAKSNHLVSDLARGSYLRELQNVGSRIMLYTPGMMHAKVMVVDDDLAIVGSANLNLRSLFLDYEACIFSYTSGDVAAVGAWFESLVRESHEGVPEASALQDVLDGVFRIMSPLL